MIAGRCTVTVTSLYKVWRGEVDSLRREDKQAAPRGLVKAALNTNCTEEHLWTEASREASAQKIINSAPSL